MKNVSKFVILVLTALIGVWFQKWYVALCVAALLIVIYRGCSVLFQRPMLMG